MMIFMGLPFVFDDGVDNLALAFVLEPAVFVRNNRAWRSTHCVNAQQRMRPALLPHCHKCERLPESHGRSYPFPMTARCRRKSVSRRRVPPGSSLVRQPCFLRQAAPLGQPLDCRSIRPTAVARPHQRPAKCGLSTLEWRVSWQTTPQLTCRECWCTGMIGVTYCAAGRYVVFR